MGQTSSKPAASKPKPEPEAPATAPEEGGTPEGAAADELQKMREAIIAETREAAQAVLADAQATAAAMLEEARAAAADASVPQQGATQSDIAALVEALSARQDSADEKIAAAQRAKEQTVPKAEDVEEGFEPVVFRAKGINFCVVRVPRHRWTASNGEAQMTDGVRYDFAPGRGDLTVRNEAAAEHLRGRPTFNVEFWEVGKEPHAAPDPSAVLDKITAAAMDFDAAKLRELELVEQSSHSRPVILKAIKGALDRIERAEKEA